MKRKNTCYGLMGIASIFILALLPGSRTAAWKSDLYPTSLRCEYRENPLGIQSEHPRLDWALKSEQRGQYQTAYRILVSDSSKHLNKEKDILWDSGWVESAETLHIPYEGSPLRSGQGCFWKVKIRDKNRDPSPWSKPAYWEMGLLESGAWEGIWISDGRSDPSTEKEFYREDPAPLFRKDFSCSRKIKKARLYISGLGYYEARINGQRVGDYRLDPGWTDYRDRIFYSTYNVTGMLRRGKNCLGVILGNGWYNPLPLRMWGRLNLREHLTTGRPRFIAQLNIEYSDGTVQTLCTDPEWMVHSSPLLKNNVYLGEVYDARREVAGWDCPGLDTQGWTKTVAVPSPGGKLEAQPQPPIRITGELEPVEISEPNPGVFIFDFGENFAGTVRLRLKAASERIIRLRYGELVDRDGNLNPMTSVCGQIKGKRRDGRNIGGEGSPEVAVQEDIYITNGKGTETYSPRFTFRGFRYVEVTGLPGKPAITTLTGLRLNSDVPSAGWFECSSTLVNRIQEMTRRTFLSNLFSVQSDCPHREKFGYGGDLAVTSDAFILNFDMAAFYAKAARDWDDAALAEGMLTDTAPFVGIQYCGVPWAMAHPHLLFQLYQYYGNRRLMEEQYGTAKKWLDRVKEENPDRIIRNGLSDHEGLEPSPAPEMVTPLFYQSARLLAHLADLLEKTQDQKRYTRLAEEIKEAYVRNFHSEGIGKFQPSTQASQAYALYLGLVPEKEIEAALTFLIEKINKEARGHLSTGIFGTKFLLDVLSRYGRSDVAWRIVSAEGFPGWTHMLEKGATTLWEHWEYSDNTFSHNHPMFGSISEWFFKWMAGIQPASGAVGFDRIEFRPQPVEGIDWVRSEYKSIRGDISSRWILEDGLFRLKIHLPPNTHGIVYLPTEDPETVQENGRPIKTAEGILFKGYHDRCAVFEISSGTYDFSSHYNEKHQ